MSVGSRLIVDRSSESGLSLFKSVRFLCWGFGLWDIWWRQQADLWRRNQPACRWAWVQFWCQTQNIKVLLKLSEPTGLKLKREKLGAENQQPIDQLPLFYQAQPVEIEICFNPLWAGLSGSCSEVLGSVWTKAINEINNLKPEVSWRLEMKNEGFLNGVWFGPVCAVELLVVWMLPGTR